VQLLSSPANRPAFSFQELVSSRARRKHPRLKPPPPLRPLPHPAQLRPGPQPTRPIKALDTPKLCAQNVS